MISLTCVDGTVCYLQAVPYFYREVYEHLRGRLQVWWDWSGHYIGELAAQEQAWGLLQQCVNQLPRLDCPGVRGVDLDQVDWRSLQLLIPALDELHQLDPVEFRQEEDEDLIVPASDDPTANMLADLSFRLGYQDAIALLQTVDLNRLNKLIYRANEVSIPKDERKQAAIKRDWEDWKRNNQTIYRESLGIPAGFNTETFANKLLPIA